MCAPSTLPYIHSTAGDIRQCTKFGFVEESPVEAVSDRSTTSVLLVPLHQDHQITHDGRTQGKSEVSVRRRIALLAELVQLELMAFQRVSGDVELPLQAVPAGAVLALLDDMLSFIFLMPNVKLCLA